MSLSEQVPTEIWVFAHNHHVRGGGVVIIITADIRGIMRSLEYEEPYGGGGELDCDIAKILRPTTPSLPPRR